MTNNDILRSVRYILNLNEAKLLEIICLTGFKVSYEDLLSFLKQEDEVGYQNCGDKVLAYFLQGLIIFKRGKRDGESSRPVDITITNNIILKRLRVAFQLKDTDIIKFIGKTGLKISKAELNAFFRNPEHRNYRDCGNQFLRNLLKGMSV
jgi:uncharacterized protein YehS (DUF1456 family)